MRKYNDITSEGKRFQQTLSSHAIFLKSYKLQRWHIYKLNTVLLLNFCVHSLALPAWRGADKLLKISRATISPLEAKISSLEENLRWGYCKRNTKITFEYQDSSGFSWNLQKLRFKIDAIKTLYMCSQLRKDNCWFTTQNWFSMIVANFCSFLIPDFLLLVPIVRTNCTIFH